MEGQIEIIRRMIFERFARVFKEKIFQAVILKIKGYIKRKMIVTMNASPHPMPTNRNRVLSIRILRVYSWDDMRNSEVTRSIMAVEANHRLISVKVSGMFIPITISSNRE